METKNHAELAQIKQWVDSLNCNQTTPDEKKAMLNRLSALEQCEGPLDFMRAIDSLRRQIESVDIPMNLRVKDMVNLVIQKREAEHLRETGRNNEGI